MVKYGDAERIGVRSLDAQGLGMVDDARVESSGCFCGSGFDNRWRGSWGGEWSIRG